jgi:hypothetical protein
MMVITGGVYLKCVGLMLGEGRGGGLYPKRNLKARGLTLISVLLSWMWGRRYDLH